MFRSIFARLLTTYMLITVLVIASMTMILAVVYKDAVFSEKKETLDLVAQKANLLTQDYNKQKISEQELNAAVNGMAYSTSSVIYILKIDKAQFDRQQGMALNGLDESFVARNVKLVLSGQTVFQEKQYAKDLGTYVLFTGYPLTINEKIEGAILILCPISNINKIVANMNLIILVVAIAMIILSVPFIYFNSRRISKPIKEMDATARRIAEGEKANPTIVASQDEIGRLSNTFNYMKDQIEKTEKMRNDLIADISHELRTPLTSINGFVKGILDGIVEPKDYREYMVLIQGETKRLIRLTSDLLDLAKIQSGGAKMQREQIHVGTFVEEVLSVLNGSAENKHLSVINKVPPELYILADPSAFKQILINIISNAIKYTPEKGEIVIVAEAVQHSNEVCLMVQDTGIGIAAEDLPFIFEKFYRSDKVRNAEDKSTGLGLAIAKNLVELNGGSIRAESTEGTGTSLKVVLPSLE
ncbi:ATP-binding protein [Dehalobacter restrictus]|uniref:sensor histidine kinase n=1 Tax=Dehalobacter restrictus TaxID=55583 RepID=UPI00338F775B